MTHSPQTRAKIAAAMRGNTNGRKSWGVKRPGSRKAGVRNLVERGVPARMASPMAGPFETNVHAVEFFLTSPDGTEYEGRNLALFVREHADLFDPVDVAEEKIGATGQATCRAYRQLAKLLREPQRRSWKGWRK